MIWDCWCCEIAGRFRWGNWNAALGWLFKQRRAHSAPLGADNAGGICGAQNANTSSPISPEISDAVHLALR